MDRRRSTVDAEEGGDISNGQIRIVDVNAENVLDGSDCNLENQNKRKRESDDVDVQRAKKR